MKVPIIDLVSAYNEQRESLDKAVLDVLASGYYVSGPKVKKLEERTASYMGTRDAAGVASGTEALRLAMQALGVGKGDEILTPVFTFFACSSTIALLGAKPVFVDMNRDDFNIDVDDLRNRITPKTKGIIAVHLYGHPCRMDEILNIAEEHKLFVIEDCAQSFGAEYKRKKTGSIGILGTISYYPTKNLHACGEGGMIIGSDEELMNRVKLLRSHAENPRYHHHMLGVNSRMQEIQAALIDVKFDLLERWNKRRCEIASRYNREFANLPLTLPPVESDTMKPVFHTYTLRSSKRDELMKFLQSKEIGVMLYYPVPMHLQPVFKRLKYRKGDYPNAEEACGQVLSIPIHPYLSEDQVEYVISSMKEFFGN
jgi:dTDP-4-amino-4,6-dideoxygalactose transaminase